MSNIYCGAKDVPKNKKRGGMRECSDKRQIRYWGIKKADIKPEPKKEVKKVIKKVVKKAVKKVVAKPESTEVKKVVKKVVAKPEPTEVKKVVKRIIPHKAPLLEMPKKKPLPFKLQEILNERYFGGYWSGLGKKMRILMEDLKAVQEATKTTDDAKTELNDIKNNFEVINKTILHNRKTGLAGWHEVDSLHRLMMKNDTIIKWLKKQPNVKYEDNTPYYNREIRKYSNFDLDHYNSSIDTTKEYLQILPHYVY